MRSTQICQALPRDGGVHVRVEHLEYSVQEKFLIHVKTFKEKVPENLPIKIVNFSPPILPVQLEQAQDFLKKSLSKE